MGYFPTHYVTIIWFRPLLWSEFKRRVWLLQTSPMNFMKSIDKSESDWIWLILKCMYTYILPPANLVQYFKVFWDFYFHFPWVVYCMFLVCLACAIISGLLRSSLSETSDSHVWSEVNNIALISCLLDYIRSIICSYIAQFIFIWQSKYWLGTFI